MEEKPLIVLKGLEGNPPTSLTPFQKAILPYEHYLEVFWWSLWIATLTFLLIRFIVIPLWERKGKLES